MNDTPASSFDLQHTTYGMWAKARLKEELDPELYANIGEVKVEQFVKDGTMRIIVRRKDWLERFVINGVYRVNPQKGDNRLMIPQVELARLMLFLQ